MATPIPPGKMLPFVDASTKLFPESVMDALAGALPGGAVDSVNGQSGVVVLGASDVGAQPAGDYVSDDELADAIAGVTITITSGTSMPDGSTPGKIYVQKAS